MKLGFNLQKKSKRQNKRVNKMLIPEIHIKQKNTLLVSEYKTSILLEVDSAVFNGVGN